MTATQTTPAATAAAAKPAVNEKLKGFNLLISNPRTQNYLSEVLHDKKNSFVNNIVALVSNSENLQNCDPQSILFAGIRATVYDLPLDNNLGYAYIIPYWDNKTKKQVAQFQLGYRGELQLIIRSGQAETINATDVREGELESEDILTGEIKLRRVENRESKKIIGYAAYIRLINGFTKTIYATREEIEAHALRFSKQKTREGQLANVWASDFDAMAKKTVLKQLVKFAPLTVEVARAFSDDDKIDNNTVDTTATIVNADEEKTISMDDDEATPAETQPQPQNPQPTTAAGPGF